jgi:hypothetical protein
MMLLTTGHRLACYFSRRKILALGIMAKSDFDFAQRRTGQVAHIADYHDCPINSSISTRRPDNQHAPVIFRSGRGCTQDVAMQIPVS